MLALLSVGLLAACSTPAPVGSLFAHLHAAPPAAQPVPEPVPESATPETNAVASPVPQPLPAAPAAAVPAEDAPPAALEKRYSLSIRDMPVGELLLMLAQDSGLELDVHPGVEGVVTLNAVKQPLSRLFSRIARQAAIRFEREGEQISVLPDTPYLQHYKVDYVNLSRQVSGAVATSTQIATATGGDTAASVLDSGNVSSTRVENASENRFWATLAKSVVTLLAEAGEIAEAGSQNVIAHPESGVVTVRATHRQHARVREFLTRVEEAARRQVMIEATIVEVALDDGYQQGIEWNRIWKEGNRELGLQAPALANSGNATTLPFVLDFRNRANPLELTLKLLQSFGTAKVLSSPRLSVLNNQTALLKVVENVVYFSIKADVTPGNANSNPVVAYTTTPQTVSVGLVMTVTPQISEAGSVILNVRPTISSISGMVKDPNPDIPNSISNEIPQIRTREIESILRVESGEIAVLGGLMEDRVDYATGRLPLLGQVPLAGELFTRRENMARKSELVIFLRPVILHAPGLTRDFAHLAAFLPDADFFAIPPEAQLLNPAWSPREKRLQ
jgi:general secretion pathway protein D